MSTSNRQQTLTKLSRFYRVSGLLAVIFLFSFFLSGCRKAPLYQAELSSGCERVVSLSPSITEVLYELDLGPQVAGVTRYCKYPLAAQKKPQVGGYVDPDSEALIRLKPDLVIMREEQTQLARQLKGLGFSVMGVDHRNTEGILESIERIGKVCRREGQAQRLNQDLRRRIEAVRSEISKAKTRPSVLVVLDRDIQSEKLHWAFVAGEDGFYDWLIEHAGGKNAVPEGKKGFLQVSPEGILRMNPDVIIETTATVGRAITTEEIARKTEKQWANLSRVSAIQNHRLHHFRQDYMVIPGPRFIQILEQFAQAVHPELDWKHDQPAAAASLR